MPSSIIGGYMWHRKQQAAQPSQQTVGQVMWLASAYSLGLGIPFLVMAAGLNHGSGWTTHMRPYREYFKIASGVLIIVIGVLLPTSTMSLIAIWALKNGYSWCRPTWAT